MNRGLVIKAAREVAPITMLIGLGVMLVTGILGYVLPTFERQIATQLLQMPFLKNFVEAAVGTDLSGGIGPRMLSSVVWVHPVVLALIWAHAVICCTRVPAGEVDRGTIDVLLGLPISRWTLLVSESVVWIVSAITILLAAMAGNRIGGMWLPDSERLDLAAIAIIMLNLLCLYLAVGGAAWLVSALSDRRGRAITIVFAMVLASFLLNYLAQFWSPAKHVAFLSILRYHRPVFVVRDGSWPLTDMAVLLTIGATCWTIAGVVMSRRDLTTV